MKGSNSSVSGQAVSNHVRGLDGSDALLGEQVLAEIDAGRFEMPIFPPTARRILAITRNTEIDDSGLTLLIGTDPILSVMVLRQTGTPSVSAAVAENGPDTLRTMLTGRALRQARSPRSSWAKQEIALAYRHCMEVAAYCSVIGENLKGLDADKALLCGLLNDIGVFPVVAAIDDRIGVAADARISERVVQRLRDLVGSMLLSRWGMDRDLVTAVEEAENWLREGSTRPDYTDVLQVAKLHSYIGTPRALEIPEIEGIRSFRKIAGNPPPPRFGIALKHASRRRLAAWEQTLERLMSNRREA